MNTALLDGLNYAQRAAVLHDHSQGGPLLILAGAGSGKTSVLTRRIIYLVAQGVAPSAILGLTFTAKAAAEMLERVGHSCPGVRIRLCTFHSLALSLLRESFGGQFGWERAGFSLVPIPGEPNPRNWLQQLASVGLGRLGLPRDQLFDPRVSSIKGIGRLRKAVLESGDVAFEDLIYCATKLVRGDSLVRRTCRGRWTHFLVDEYQDINPSQYEFVRVLQGDSPHLFVVGDDDQAIYGFRGADIGNILRFQADHPGCRVLKLEWNYRSTASILQLANRIFADKSPALQKNLRPGSPSRGALFDADTPVEIWRCPHPRDEIERIQRSMQELRLRYSLQWQDFALLVRYNRQAEWYRLALRSLGVPLQSSESSGVRIETVHASKGLQYPVVYYCGMAQGLTPGECRGSKLERRRQAEEERRLFYVGITRAESLLVLLFCGQRHWKGELLRFRPSPYLRICSFFSNRGTPPLPPLLFKIVVTLRVLFYMAIRMAGYFYLKVVHKERARKWLEIELEKFCRFSLHCLRVDLKIIDAVQAAKVDWGRPVFVVANHQSFADIPLCLLAAGRMLGFIAKRELGAIPFLSYWMRQIGCLLIDRKQQGVGRQVGTQLLGQGRAVHLAVFPEGTRNRIGSVGNFKTGAFWLASQCGGQILPVVICGSRKSWEDYSSHDSRILCKVRVLEPLDCQSEGRSAKQLAKDLERQMRGELEVLQECG